MIRALLMPLVLAVTAFVVSPSWAISARSMHGGAVATISGNTFELVAIREGYNEVSFVLYASDRSQTPITDGSFILSVTTPDNRILSIPLFLTRDNSWRGMASVPLRGTCRVKETYMAPGKQPITISVNAKLAEGNTATEPQHGGNLVQVGGSTFELVARRTENLVDFTMYVIDSDQNLVNKGFVALNVTDPLGKMVTVNLTPSDDKAYHATAVLPTQGRYRIQESLIEKGKKPLTCSLVLNSM